jgi:hypothetical protein
LLSVATHICCIRLRSCGSSPVPGLVGLVLASRLKKNLACSALEGLAALAAWFAAVVMVVSLEAGLARDSAKRSRDLCTD